jgi:hypothetical protein
MQDQREYRLRKGSLMNPADDNKPRIAMDESADGAKMINEEGIRQFKENLKYTSEFMELTAKLQMIKYKALLKAGFDAIQALELSKKIYDV